MIVDLSDEAPSELSADLCIVGSGAAGTALASEFEGSPIRVVICEAGGLDHEPATQQLYDSEVAGLPHVGVHRGRFRVAGGSTTRWGGQALPLLPSDFEKRDWVAHSGWPISFESLQAYYRRAGQFLLIDDMDFDSQVFRSLHREQAKINSLQIWHHFSKWSPQPDVRHRYLPRFRGSTNLTLLLHANVVKILLRPDRRMVESMTVRSLGGRQSVVRAKQFALCVGGIETARLLLANREQCPAGIGNGTDRVGRFFQDHPFIRVGSLRAKEPKRFQRMFNVSVKRGLRYSCRLSATPLLQRQQKMLSVSALVLFELSQQSSVQRLKNAYAKLRFKKQPLAAAIDFLLAARRPDQILYPLYRYALFGEVYMPVSQIVLAMMCEQEPLSQSRVTLADSVDALGMPRTKLDWQVSDLTIQTVRRYATVLRDAFATTGEAILEPYAWLTDPTFDWRSQIGDQSHHIGTARMANSPEHGVVDANLKLHEIDNLYIASSAVFPTGGHSNPTYTILALTFRLADRLRELLSG